MPYRIFVTLAASAALAGCNAAPIANSADENSVATAPSTLELLKAGKPEVCGDQRVKDTITSMIFPEKPDDIKQSDWEAETQDIGPNYSLITADSIDTATSSVTCNMLIKVGSKIIREYRVTYKISPSIDEPGNFVVEGDFAQAKQTLVWISEEIAGRIRGKYRSAESENQELTDEGRNEAEIDAIAANAAADMAEEELE